MPRVLVSDKLSPTAVQIFKDRGVDVDYMPDLGKDKEKLAEIIGKFDGLAIRIGPEVGRNHRMAGRDQPPSQPGPEATRGARQENSNK